MQRRTARLRREFLYRKSLEGKEREVYERKRKVRIALAEGKPIPTELKHDEAGLRAEVELEDVRTAQRPRIDDEYAMAAHADPKILLTTSRDPSSRLVQFAKELKLVFPNAQRVNRGGQVVGELVEQCRTHDFTDLIMVHEHRGEPDGLVVSHMPFGPTAYFGLVNTVTRHDIKGVELGTVSEAHPHLVLEGFTSQLGERVANILKWLFPTAKHDSKRIITFANQSEYISFRHHTYEMPRGAASTQLKEVGPRFELRLYQIRLGTIDQPQAELEWALRPYMRKQGARQSLSAPEKK
mmetsp:Transcript_28512/g.93159  ORF Transcript_28512/g.93159 Transcript_28512/m.93159 type:complete len:296 (-) Transcript_28512:87-974(-)